MQRIRRPILRAVLFLAVLTFLCEAAAQTAPEYDLLLRGARVIDGTGNPWRHADVAVLNGRIAAVGNLRDARARRVIEAPGRYLAPGFIDMHSHSDLPLLVDGNAESKIRQGVTTEILGESTSAGPAYKEARELLQRRAARFGLKPDWGSLGEYFERLGRRGISVNVASYVGLGSVRASVMGLQERTPAPGELEEMKSLVTQAMREGAWGLSNSLIEFPDRYAKTGEIIELARVAAAHGGIYATHMRSERRHVLSAIDEAIEISGSAGLPVEIFHFKVSGHANWGQMPAAIRKVESARVRGIDVTANVYPYTASTDPLEVLLPPWAREGGTKAMLARLQDPALKPKIQAEMAQAPPGGDDLFRNYEAVMISRAGSEKNQGVVGKRVTEIARERKLDPKDAIFQLILEEQSDINIVNFVINDDEMRQALRQPWVSIGSDGSALTTQGVLAQGKPHPRSYGAFPRVLEEYVRVEGLFPLEEAIRKMTSAPARRLGIRDRGEIREGMWADLVIFDLGTMDDRADFEVPQQYPSGIEYVVVNGELVLERGAHTGRRPGRILYGPGTGSKAGR
jgi:N-acyl-D-amino-acid deacylase